MSIYTDVRFFLQFFHEELNKDLFEGVLESAIIVLDDLEVNTWATVETSCDPFCIRFDANTAIELYEHDKKQLLTVLLHEMIHQHNAEINITDTDEDGTHLPVFREVAYEHGLKQQGYVLTDEAAVMLEKRIKNYEAIMSSTYKVFPSTNKYR